MNNNILSDVKKIVIATVGNNLDLNSLTDDFHLIGNILDSMSVTNLILALEDSFGFLFDEEDLSAEAFETISSLSELVKRKIAK